MIMNLKMVIIWLFLSIMIAMIKIGFLRRYRSFLTGYDDGRDGVSCIKYMERFRMKRKSLQLPDKLIAQMEKNVIVLKNVLSINDLKDDKMERMIETDCDKYGVVKSINIPYETDVDEDIGDTVDVYVEFETLDQAKYARDCLYGSSYSVGHDIIVQFVDSHNR